MACEKCNPHGTPSTVITDRHRIYENENFDRSYYVYIDQITGGGKSSKIRIESGCNNLVNRGEFKVNFCYNCGADLRQKDKLDKEDLIDDISNIQQLVKNLSRKVY